MLICMLACYLTWPLRQGLGTADLHRRELAAPPPVAPRPPLRPGQATACCQDDLAGQPSRGFRGLLDHLAALTRDQVRFAGAPATVPMLTEPASAMPYAFEFLGIPIPPTLT